MQKTIEKTAKTAKKTTRFLLCCLFIYLPCLVCVANAKYKNYQVVKGVAIHLGVFPSAMIADSIGQSPKIPESQADKVLDEDHKYYLTVALFDNQTGQRITDAKVWARLSENWFSSRTKQLDKMTIADAITYGNYFELPDEGPYQFQIQIHLPGKEKVIKANFKYLNIWANPEKPIS